MTNILDRIELRLTRLLRSVLRPAPVVTEALVDDAGIVPRAPLARMDEPNDHDANRWLARRDEFNRRWKAVELRRVNDRRLLTNGRDWRFAEIDAANARKKSEAEAKVRAEFDPVRVAAEVARVVPINSKSRKVA